MRRFIGWLWGGNIFLKKRFFFVHALFAFIFEFKHKINFDFKRLINTCVRRDEKRTAFTCNAKQTRKLNMKKL